MEAPERRKSFVPIWMEKTFSGGSVQTGGGVLSAAIFVRSIRDEVEGVWLYHMAQWWFELEELRLEADESQRSLRSICVDGFSSIS
jgi:hypothetical protein